MLGEWRHVWWMIPFCVCAVHVLCPTSVPPHFYARFAFSVAFFLLQPHAFEGVYVCTRVYSMSPSSMLKLDLRLESTEASGDIADSSGSPPPMGDKASSIIRKLSSPLLP